MLSVRPVAHERMPELLRRMPKAELHVHIEGTLEPPLIFALARRNGVALPYADEATFQAACEFEGLESFLAVYRSGASVLRERADFTAMADAYLARAAADGVRHVEIFFDTQDPRDRGLKSEDVILGLHEACAGASERHGLSAGLILCFLRHLSEADAFASLEAASGHLDKLLGVGLAGGERGHPPAGFTQVFARARAMGLRTVAHAGEEGPPAYVREALDLLKVDRIDHGVRAMEDAGLVARLKAEQVPLTVCPISNLRLRLCTDLAAHPLRRMLEAGLHVSVHSDDPSYFGAGVNDNYQRSFAALGLDAGHAYRLARNSFLASFLCEADRQRELDRLDSFFETFR